MSSLPRDFASDILAALPVKDLLRFRCVSSSICSLIDSPYFTKLHLSGSEKTKSGYLFIFETINEIKSLHFDSLQNGPEIYPPPVIPQTNPCNKTEIMASCNGVVVLRTGSGAPSLWNPFTRKFRQLPSCEITDQKPEHFRLPMVYGLGCDSETDDYKLLNIAYFKASYFSNASDISKAAVFSLKTNTWREIDCPPSVSFSRIAATHSGAFVNNALHWARYVEPEGLMIFAFNLAKEEFYIVPHPDFDLGGKKVVVLGGCLAMVNNNLGHDASVDVWVMKDYGVKESWSKLLFLPRSRYTQFDYQSSLVYPIAYSRDSKKILLNHECYLSWYDLTTETLDIVNVLDNGNHGFDSSLFMESLVALH